MSQKLPPRQQAALIFGGVASIVPALVVAGFFPGAEEVLPVTHWLAIATIGSAVAGVISSPRRWLRSSIAGAIAGGGGFIGLLLYIFLRYQLFNSDTFLHLEFILGVGLGALPGLLLFRFWVKPSLPKTTQPQQ